MLQNATKPTKKQLRGIMGKHINYAITRKIKIQSENPTDRLRKAVRLIILAMQSTLIKSFFLNKISLKTCQKKLNPVVNSAVGILIIFRNLICTKKKN